MYLKGSSPKNGLHNNVCEKKTTKKRQSDKSPATPVPMYPWSAASLT